MSELPPGFVLDQAPDAGLPPGFVLDSPSVMEDAAKSVGSGLANATAGLIGGAGDLRSLASAGVSAVGDRLGVAPDKVQAFKDMLTRVARATPAALVTDAPTSRQVKDSAADPIVSPDYKPETKLGEFLKTGAEFAPGLLVGGQGGLTRQLLTNVAIPAVASEAAGQLTQGTALEPWARGTGALTGGLGSASVADRFNRAALARQATKAIPAGEDLLQAGSRGFQAVNNSDAVINPSSIQALAGDIRKGLLSEGYHPTLGAQSGIFKTIDRLEELGGQAGVTPRDLEVIRKNLVAEKTNLDRSTASAARKATDDFMSRYAGMGEGDLLSGANPFPTLKDAVGNWAAGKRSAAVTGKRDLAELNAGTAGSGANEDNALRQAMKQLARPKNNTNTPVAKTLGFNDQEVAAIKDAAMGTTVGNTARWLGKAAPTGIVSGAGAAGIGGFAAGPIGAVALPAAGYIAKKIGDLSTKKQVAALDSLVRSNSPLARQVAAQLPQVVAQLPPRSRVLLSGIVPTIAPTVPTSQNR
jgi:hypothetical protein